MEPLSEVTPQEFRWYEEAWEPIAGLVLAGVSAALAFVLGWSWLFAVAFGLLGFASAAGVAFVRKAARAKVPAFVALEAWAEGVNAALTRMGVAVVVAIVCLIGVIRISPGDVDGTVFVIACTTGALFYVRRGLVVFWSRGEAEVRTTLVPFGRFIPFLYPAGFFAEALAFFTGLTALLVRFDVIAFSDADPSSPRVAAFFLWNFLNLVPLVEIPNTLNWSDPLTYTGWPPGVLLLAFYGIAVLPVIQMARYVWQRRHRGG